MPGYTSSAILSQLIPGYASLDILSQLFLDYPNLRFLYRDIPGYPDLLSVSLIQMMHMEKMPILERENHEKSIFSSVNFADQ